MRTYIIAIALLTACGTTPAKSPEPIVEAEIRQPTFDYDNTPTEKVGMVFEDKRDEERRDRTPPPTSSYKISRKTDSTK